MRNAWLALALCVSSLILAEKMIAAEKSRDWQTGQVVESKARADSRVHAIAGKDKTYLVRGSIGGDDDVLAVGATVRYAVQGTTMFLSIEGNEYRLSVLGTTVRTAPPTPVASPAVKPAQASPAVTPVQKDSAAPYPRAAAVKPPAATDELLLDNDAVVKMITGGLNEDTVVSVIQARPGKYILAPDALAALKAAGVPQRVITAMSVKMSAQH
jgi:hypothetical protein